MLLESTIFTSIQLETGLSIIVKQVGLEEDAGKRDIKKQLNIVCEENVRLKRLMAEKSIVEDLMKISNPLMPTKLK